MEEIIIQSPNGNVFGVLQLPEGKTPAPLIILSHGFGGNHTLDMDSAAHFVSAGFATYNLDFCGGGFNSKSSGTDLGNTFTIDNIKFGFLEWRGNLIFYNLCSCAVAYRLATNLDCFDAANFNTNTCIEL